MEELTAPIKYENKQLERIATLCKFEGLKCYAIANNSHTAPRFDELFISFDSKYYINIYTMFNKAIYVSTNNAPSLIYGDGIIKKIYTFKDFIKMRNDIILKDLQEVWLASKNLCEKEKLNAYSTQRLVKYYKVCDIKRLV